MKTYIKNPFLALACTGFLAIPAAAQTFTLLHSFAYTNDGANPQASLILYGNTLYGTAAGGGSGGYGTVFAVNTDGTGFTNLHSFTGSDGYSPRGGVVLSGNTLYGATYGGGDLSSGTVFALNTDGTGFTNLHSFGSSDGTQPIGGLILSGNTLYGTTSANGSVGNGTAFAVNTDGSGFAVLHSFGYPGSDGGDPEGGLILSGNTLYGTALYGGTNDLGTVFALNTGGTNFTVLHSFPAYPSDGANVFAGVILSGNTLYGTTRDGGSGGNGKVFAGNINGTGFTNVYSFTGGSDGGDPYAGLILSSNTLYGTVSSGGSADNGAVFAVNTDGTGFTNLHSFNYSDGSHPIAGLILSGNTLYGAALGGGSEGNGTVFSLSLPPPQLTIISSGTHVILTWPTYAPGVTLQFTTNLVSPAVWSTVSPEAVVVNGQNAVTNPISGSQEFYRLIQ